MKQLAIRLGCEKPQPSRWLSRKRARGTKSRDASLVLYDALQICLYPWFLVPERLRVLRLRRCRGLMIDWLTLSPMGLIGEKDYPRIG